LLEDIESCGDRTEDGCLLWKHTCTGKRSWNNMQGYGKVWTGDRDARVIRVVWHHFVDNTFPLWMEGDRGGLVPNHLCPNTNCYEPTHLELETTRNNVIKGKLCDLREGMTSQYVGVRWVKESRKWVAKIYWQGRHRYIGSFDDELDAANAYQDFIKQYVNLRLYDTVNINRIIQPKESQCQAIAPNVEA
jgi:hypothetical protein